MDAVEFFQIMLYILGSILLVVLIVLGIRLTVVMNKIEMLVDNINTKAQQLNNMFNIIDVTTGKINLFTDKIVESTTGLIKKVFNKKKKEDDKNE